MSRSICAGLVDETNSITVATLSLEVENIIGNSLQRSINWNVSSNRSRYNKQNIL